MTEWKYCKDCKWIDQIPPTMMPLCEHPDLMTPPRVDLVDGKQIPAKSLPCGYLREKPEQCGPDGVRWEQIA